jgi:hypothetical protein
MNIRPENQAYLWPPPAQSKLRYAKILASLKIKDGISLTADLQK